MGNLVISRAEKQENVFACMSVCSVAKTCLFATPWTVAHQAPLSMGFPRQEQWSVLPEEMVFNNGIVVFISMCVLRCKRSAASLYFP